MARGQARVVQAELLGEAGPEVREDDVGAGQQPLDHRAGAGVAQVEWQRVLAAVARDEVARLAGRQRRQVADRIASERLDLDHVGAALGQELRAERDGDELAELHDLESGERPGVVRHGRLTISITGSLA